MFSKWKNTEHKFEKQIEPHIGNLYRIACRFCGNESDAQDLVQDLLVKLYQRHEALDLVEQLQPWLARALYHQFIDNLRRTGKHLQEVDIDDHGANMVSDDCPLETTEQQIQVDRLQAVFSALNPDQRVVLTLHDIEGYTLVELQTVHLLWRIKNQVNITLFLHRENNLRNAHRVGIEKLHRRDDQQKAGGHSHAHSKRAQVFAFQGVLLVNPRHRHGQQTRRHFRDGHRFQGF